MKMFVLTCIRHCALKGCTTFYPLTLTHTITLIRTLRPKPYSNGYPNAYPNPYPKSYHCPNPKPNPYHTLNPYPNPNPNPYLTSNPNPNPQLYSLKLFLHSGIRGV